MGSSSIPLILPRISNPDLEREKYFNWLLSLRERRERADTVDSKPFELTIDPATVCQLSCPYCSTGAGTMQRSRGTLGPSVHRRFLDQLGETAFLIWYFSTGEPLLNKRLPDLVALNQGREVYSIISTNLSLPLSDARIESLLVCGLGCISVSLDGATAETYSRYRVGGDFDLVMSNLRRLVKRKRELGLDRPHLEWRFLVFEHNRHEVALTRRMAEEIGVDLLEFFPGYAPPDAGESDVRSAGPVDLDPVVSGPALTRAAERPMTPLMRALGTGIDGDLPILGVKGYGTKCDWLYFGTTLFPNGSVSPCCLSNEEADDFGIVSEDTTFSEVWNSDRYREARSLFVSQEWSTTDRICARCPNRDAQDFQFRTTTQALLRNAPPWVLRILTADPDAFFYDVDRRLCPLELGPIWAGTIELPGRFPEAEQWLASRSSRWAEQLRSPAQVRSRVGERLPA